MGRVGVGLLGLLEPVDPKPGEAAVAEAHVEVTIGEAQAVREFAVLRVSIRRPIEAVAANLAQLTRVVATQGGQIEVFACVSGRRKDTRCGPATFSFICTPINAVDSGVAVVITFGLQY